MTEKTKWENILFEINKQKNVKIWKNIDRIVSKVRKKWKKG